jgi:GNAT superfamily N-acetyltransferase
LATGRIVDFNVHVRTFYTTRPLSPDWRIGCIFTGSRYRGRGVARAAVRGALDAIQAAGGGVEAYPEQTVDRKPQRGAYLHTGPEELYEQFGFVRDRRIAKWRWVMRTDSDDLPREPVGEPNLPLWAIA